MNAINMKFSFYGTPEKLIKDCTINWMEFKNVRVYICIISQRNLIYLSAFAIADKVQFKFLSLNWNKSFMKHRKYDFMKI